MTEVIKLLERQAEWQKQRKELSWPEKLRQARAIRDSILQLRQAGCAVKEGFSGKGS